MNPTEVSKLHVDGNAIRATITIPAGSGFTGTDVDLLELCDSKNPKNNRIILMTSSLTRLVGSVSFTIPKLSQIIAAVVVGNDLGQLETRCYVNVFVKGKVRAELVLTYTHRPPLLYLVATVPGADLETMTYRVAPGVATTFEVKYIPAYLAYPFFAAEADSEKGDIYEGARLSLLNAQSVPVPGGPDVISLVLNAAGTQTFAFTAPALPECYLQAVTDSPGGRQADKTNLVVIEVTTGQGLFSITPSEASKLSIDGAATGVTATLDMKGAVAATEVTKLVFRILVYPPPTTGPSELSVVVNDLTVDTGNSKRLTFKLPKLGDFDFDPSIETGADIDRAWECRVDVYVKQGTVEKIFGTASFTYQPSD